MEHTSSRATRPAPQPVVVAGLKWPTWLRISNSSPAARCQRSVRSMDCCSSRALSLTRSWFSCIRQSFWRSKPSICCCLMAFCRCRQHSVAHYRCSECMHACIQPAWPSCRVQDPWCCSLLTCCLRSAVSLFLLALMRRAESRLICLRRSSFSSSSSVALLRREPTSLLLLLLVSSLSASAICVRGGDFHR